jgi:hypothetical protein
MGDGGAGGDGSSDSGGGMEYHGEAGDGTAGGY